jgi:hypothetical protein
MRTSQQCVKLFLHGSIHPRKRIVERKTAQNTNGGSHRLAIHRQDRTYTFIGKVLDARSRFDIQYHNLIMKESNFLRLPRSLFLSIRRPFFVILTVTFPTIVAFRPTSTVSIFHPKPPSAISTARAAGRSSNNRNSDDDSNDSMFDNDAAVLTERLQRMRLEILEEEWSRPPKASLKPTQVVEAIMHGLLSPYDPLPDSGFRLLLQTASPRWRNAIVSSVGGGGTMTSTSSSSSSGLNVDSPLGMDLVASALGSSMGRPHNQFAILVGEGEDYVLDFPTEPLDFGDGTCWIECRLRDKQSGELLVITGWDLCQRDGGENDSPWMVDWIYWQDFRDEFRPGVGREEWLLEV